MGMGMGAGMGMGMGGGMGMGMGAGMGAGAGLGGLPGMAGMTGFPGAAGVGAGVGGVASATAAVAAAAAAAAAGAAAAAAAPAVPGVKIVVSQLPPHLQSKDMVRWRRPRLCTACVCVCVCWYVVQCTHRICLFDPWCLLLRCSSSVFCRRSDPCSRAPCSQTLLARRGYVVAVTVFRAVSSLLTCAVLGCRTWPWSSTKTAASRCSR